MELNKIYNEDCHFTMKRMPKNYVDVIDNTRENVY